MACVWCDSVNLEHIGVVPVWALSMVLRSRKGRMYRTWATEVTSAVTESFFGQTELIDACKGYMYRR